MTDMTEACPECGSGRTAERVSQTPKFLCRECRSEFDEPDERPIRPGHANGTLSAKLVEMDADDVNRETAGLE